MGTSSPSHSARRSKQGAQPAEVLGQAGLGQPAAAGRGTAGQVQFVGLDVAAAQIGDAGDVRGVGGKPGGELAQHALDTHHRRRPQRQPHLGDVAQQRRRQPVRDRRPLRRPLGRAVPVGLAGRGVERAEVEQGGLGAEQRRAQRLGPVAVGAVTAEGVDQRLPPLVDHALGRLLGGEPGQGRHLDQRRPLQAGDDAVEAEVGGGGAEAFVESPMVVGGDLTEIGPARHQIVGGGHQAPGHDQPADHPPVLERQGALVGQRQAAPTVGSDPGEEHAGDRRHRVAGEHAGGDKVSSIRGDQVFDVGAPCPGPAHRAAGTTWASIASAARRYSFSNQSLASCR